MEKLRVGRPNKATARRLDQLAERAYVASKQEPETDFIEVKIGGRTQIDFVDGHMVVSDSELASKRARNREIVARMKTPDAHELAHQRFLREIRGG